MMSFLRLFAAERTRALILLQLQSATAHRITAVSCQPANQPTGPECNTSNFGRPDYLAAWLPVCYIAIFSEWQVRLSPSRCYTLLAVLIVGAIKQIAKHICNMLRAT